VGGLGGVPLWLKSTLTSPAGANYNLYVYVPANDTRECTTVTKSSTSTAASDSAWVEFGETGAFANGSKDDRTVTVEVRYVSGPCGVSDKWTLSVAGNTQ
jgi:hypothetical protein